MRIKWGPSASVRLEWGHAVCICEVIVGGGGRGSIPGDCGGQIHEDKVGAVSICEVRVGACSLHL